MNKIAILLLPVVLASAVQIERDTLDNGLVVLTIEAHKIPVVEIKAYVRGGSVFDPTSKEGLANLVSQMLIRGTERFSYSEIVESIESVGGILAPFASEDYAGLSGKVLSKDLARLIDMMGDCLLYPNFDSLELSRLKRETASMIRARSDDPFEVSERGFRELVFGDHPLGHLPSGFDCTVSIISRVDVEDFYDAYYQPNNTFIICVGDFSRDSLRMLLNGKFGGWTRGEIPDEDFGEPVSSDHPVARIIPMDISQAYILLGNFGPRYSADDWHAARVMNYILGGAGLTSRISYSIREEKGLAYIAYSYFQRFVNGGYFVAEVQTKKDMVNEAVVSLLSEIKRMRDGVRLDELEWAKKFYTGYLPLAYDTYGEMANIVAQIEIAGHGLDYLDQFENYISALTIEDLNAAARSHLHPDRFYLLIVGDIKPEDVQVEGIEWIE
jgi:zinc protease